MSTREEILHAYAEILTQEGPRAATLEAIAARSKVSKGGLLYHFSSKQALAEGLLSRLAELGAQDLDAMREAADGPAAYYLRTSNYQNDEFDQLLLAASHLTHEIGSQAAEEALRATRQGWFDLIHDEVRDPAIARAILLMGDGLYYNAMLNGAVSEPHENALQDLLTVLDLLKRAP